MSSPKWKIYTWYHWNKILYSAMQWTHQSLVHYSVMVLTQHFISYWVNELCSETFLIESGSDICLAYAYFFNKCEPRYAYKCYAYKKKTMYIQQDLFWVGFISKSNSIKLHSGSSGLEIRESPPITVNK